MKEGGMGVSVSWKRKQKLREVKLLVQGRPHIGYGCNTRLHFWVPGLRHTSFWWHQAASSSGIARRNEKWTSIKAAFTKLAKYQRTAAGELRAGTEESPVPLLPTAHLPKAPTQGTPSSEWLIGTASWNCHLREMKKTESTEEDYKNTSTIAGYFGRKKLQVMELVSFRKAEVGRRTWILLSS